MIGLCKGRNIIVHEVDHATAECEKAAIVDATQRASAATSGAHRACGHEQGSLHNDITNGRGPTPPRDNSKQVSRSKSLLAAKASTMFMNMARSSCMRCWRFGGLLYWDGQTFRQTGSPRGLSQDGFQRRPPFLTTPLLTALVTAHAVCDLVEGPGSHSLRRSATRKSTIHVKRCNLVKIRPKPTKDCHQIETGNPWSGLGANPPKLQILL